MAVTRTSTTRRRILPAAAATSAVVVATVLLAAASSGAILPPPSTTSPTRPTAPTTTSIAPPRPTTTAPPATTQTPPTTAPPTTQPPPPAAPPPPQPAPPPPDEAPEAEPPCERDAVDDYYSATKDTALVVPYQAGLGINDVLTCGGAGYTISDLTDPPNGSVVKTPNDFGAFEYTPDPGFTGSDSFNYTLYQGMDVADQATAHIIVTESCSVIAFQDLYATPYETPVSEALPGFLTNDVVECQPVTTPISVSPTDGMVTGGVDGAFVYTPDPGFSGLDEFSYEIRDATQALLGTGVVVVLVDEPTCVAADDAYSTTVDTKLIIGAPGLLGNDFVCPDATTIQVAQPPGSGTVMLQPDGSFDYVPDPGFVGKDSFTYDHVGYDITVLDDVVLATATVLIDVTETPVTTTTAPSDATTTTALPGETTTTVLAGETTTTIPPGGSTTSTVPGISTTAVPSPGPEPPASTPPVAAFRIATFNASLNRAAEGELFEDLSTPDDQQAANIAAILQDTRPDIVLLLEFDYVEGGGAVDLFRSNYLLLSQRGAQPIDYPYSFIAPVNTGVPSGFDLDNDGSVGGADDAFGSGDFPGQYGMVVLSRYPIVANQVRTFQHLLWMSVPGARLPDDPATAEPALSSKSHWDVPVDVDGRIVHILAAHPTPPVFDGPEDRNGMRNADEIAFWADYVAGVDTGWIVDDAGATGGLAADAEFVIAGDLNCDPVDGDSVTGAAEQVLALDRVQDPAPSSEGAVEASMAQGLSNRTHAGDPALDTADFSDDQPGNLRVDYVLPSDGFTVVDAGVFWPSRNDERSRLVTTEPLASSDHRLVWVDLA
jgi:hypothetical protein